MPPIRDAIVPVAGLGTRLLPATRSAPKEMLPIVDKPVVQYVVEELSQAGIDRVLMVTGRRKRAIEDHFDADPELSGSDEVLAVTRMVEKPAPGTVDSRLAVAARYVLGPAVFSALRDQAPGTGGEIQLTDAISAVIEGGGSVLAVPLAGGERRHDIGTLEGYCRAFLAHALTHPQLGEALRAQAGALLHGD